MNRAIINFTVLFCLLFSFSSFTIKDEICEEEKGFIDEPKAYPNPFKSKITINHTSADKIEICTLLGEKVKIIPVSLQDKSTTLDLSDLKKGVYFYVIKFDNNVIETRRIIKSE